jgi:hypothetical protein
MALIGQCFCGRVRYRLTRDEHCSCSLCGEASTGGSSEYAEVNPDSFSWLSSEQDLTVFEIEPGWGLGFCKTCGTPICGIHEGKVHGVHLGTADCGVRVELH